MKKRGLILIVLLIPLYFIFSYLNNGTARKIEDKTIQYSEEIGWVNWGHAIATGTTKYFEDFKSKNKEEKDTFLFDYTQKMKFKIGDYELIASYSETWKVNSQLSEKGTKKAFLGVFKSVSEGFEKMQGEFPYSWIGGSVTSQREGDFTGNLISYLSATSPSLFNADSLKLTLLDYESTLKKYHEEGLNKSTWDSIKINKKTTNPVIKKLQEVLQDTSNPDENITKISFSSDFYLEE